MGRRNTRKKKAGMIREKGELAESMLQNLTDELQK